MMAQLENHVSVTKTNSGIINGIYFLQRPACTCDCMHIHGRCCLGAAYTVVAWQPEIAAELHGFDDPWPVNLQRTCRIAVPL